MKTFLHIHKNKQTQSPSRSLSGRIGRDEYVDWAIIITVVFILSIILIMNGWVAYSDIGTELSRSSNVPISTLAPTIDTDLLARILSRFDARADLRSTTLKGYSGVGDPSI